MNYPYQIQKDGDGYLVTFLDIPEAVSYGYTEIEATEMAADALFQALGFYFDQARRIPMPSPANGKPFIELEVSTWIKVLLLNEMVAGGLSQAELARRMGKKCQEVTRIVNLKHTTKIDTLTAAFKVFNKQLEFSIKPIS